MNTSPGVESLFSTVDELSDVERRIQEIADLVPRDLWPHMESLAQRVSFLRARVTEDQDSIRAHAMTDLRALLKGDA